MHGPGYDSSAGYYYAPSWPLLPSVEVADLVAKGLKPRRQEKWRELVRFALERWTRAGLTFWVIEGDPRELPPAMTDQDFQDAIVQPNLTLASLPALYGGTVLAAAGWWPAKDPGSIAAFYVGNVFWRNTTRRTKRAILTHEIGHALGLKHQDVSDSVMNGRHLVGPSPNAHDLDSLRSWYGR